MGFMNVSFSYGAGRRIALLVEGGLFSTVPTNDPEPFTVVAQSLCEAQFERLIGLSLMIRSLKFFLAPKKH